MLTASSGEHFFALLVFFARDAKSGCWTGFETAKFNAGNWSSVAERSLSEANALQSRIEGLMAFEEAAPAAATLRLHVAGMRRQLQGIDAENWKTALVDLLLINESIQSDMDELMDLAAPAPDEMPAHVHDPVGA